MAEKAVWHANKINLYLNGIKRICLELIDYIIFIMTNGICK